MNTNEELHGWREEHSGGQAVAEHAAIVQVLLAEKRTYLSVMRTAIAILALPLSITTILITLSRFYSWVENLHFLIPMGAVLAFLVVASLLMFVRSAKKIRHCDELIFNLRRKDPALRDVID